MSLLNTWDCHGVHTDEVKCSLFHIVFWDFEGRKIVTQLHELIYIYLFCCLSIQIGFDIIVIVYDIQSSYPVNMVFFLPVFIWESWLNLNIAV